MDTKSGQVLVEALHPLEAAHEGALASARVHLLGYEHWSCMTCKERVFAAKKVNSATYACSVHVYLAREMQAHVCATSNFS